MGISVADNFDHKSKKPLDARTSYTTLALMKAVTDANINEGCIAYCAETDKYYKFLSTNTVDADTGKWREFSSGGSGEDPNAYHTTDTAETTFADSDKFPFYDASASAARHSTWSNLKAKLKSYFDTVYDLNKSDIPMYGTSSTGASTTAKTASVTRGTFTLVAGAKVSIKFTNTNTASAPTLNVGSTGAKNIKYIASDGTVSTPTTWWGAGEVVTFVYDGTQWLMMPTISMMPSLPVVGTINRSDIYDTTEQVVGCYTDGRPIYQRTFSGTLTGTTTVGTEVTTEVAMGVNVNAYIDVECWAYNSSNKVYQKFNLCAPSNSNGTLRMVCNVNGHASKPNKILLFNSWTLNSDTALYYLTVRYTKTTDSANSYNYANENDYSTTEEIIGKWIDGSNIYRKVTTYTWKQQDTNEYTYTMPTGMTKLLDMVFLADWYQSSTLTYNTAIHPYYSSANDYFLFKKTTSKAVLKQVGLSSTNYLDSLKIIWTYLK